STHSFPTRRSSDLGWLAGLAARWNPSVSAPVTRIHQHQILLASRGEPEGILRYRWAAGPPVWLLHHPCLGLPARLGPLQWRREWFLRCHTRHVGVSVQSVRLFP